MHLYIQLLRKV